MQRNWDGLAALIAALIGVLALLVSGYTANIQRQQVRAQVWPFLQFGYNDPERMLGVLNKGVGPAVIRSVQVRVDGKPQSGWQQVLESLGIPDPENFNQSSLNKGVLSPGEKLTFFQLDDTPRYERFRTESLARLKVSICYCSTLDECWMYRNAGPVRVLPVDVCPAVPEADSFQH